MTSMYRIARATAEGGIEIPSEAFFGTLTGALITGIAVVVALTVFQLAGTWRESSREKLVNKLALTVNLVIPDELRPALTDHVAMRERGRLVGWSLALVALAVLLQPWRTDPIDLGPATGLVAVGLGFAGAQLGTIIGGALGRRSAPMTESVARLETIGLAELVHPLVRRMAQIAAIVAVSIPTLALIGVTILGSSTIIPVEAAASALAATGLTVGALHLALPAIARRLAARRSLRGDTAALAWSDALTGSALSDLHWLIAFSGGLAAFVSLQLVGLALPTQASETAIVIGSVVSYSAVALLVGVIVVVLTRSPERHVQRTLWPDLAIVAE